MEQYCIKLNRIILVTLLFVISVNCVAQVKSVSPIQVVQNPLAPLAPGEIKPTGWLKDWAVAAKDGIVGHLDEYDSPLSWKDNLFAKAWNANEIPYDARKVNPDGTGWPIEQSAYWLDGALRLGYILDDQTLINKIEKRLDIVVDGVNNGGDSFIYWVKGKPKDDFDGWAHSHMGRALVAYYQKTKKKEILDALVSVYKDYIPYGPLDGHVTALCNIDPMLETYAFSGNNRILANVKTAMDSVNNIIDGWSNKSEFFSGHMVVMYENTRLPSLLYPWTGDKKYLDATFNQYSWMKERGMQPYGVLAGMEHECGTGAFRKTETCNVACHLWNDMWFYRITGNGKWGESAELAFFNAAKGPVDRDFRSASYWQWPNRIIGSINTAEAYNYPYCAGNEWSRFGFANTLCCVANLCRPIPFYVTNMWMKTSDNGLAATLYGPCEVNTQLGNNTIHINCETDYPFNENITVHINPSAPATFPVHFRIPEWCTKPVLSVNGSAQKLKVDVNGFVKVIKKWSKGDLVILQFPMTPRFFQGREKDFPAEQKAYYAKDRWEFSIPEDVEGKIYAGLNLPYQSIYYGPLLFSLPIEDNGPIEVKGKPEWRYAIDNEDSLAGSDIKVVKGDMPKHWNWPLNAPIKLKVPAKKFDWKPELYAPLPDKSISEGTSATVTLVPYGCTYFRISMFPVTNRAWGGFKK